MNVCTVRVASRKACNEMEVYKRETEEIIGRFRSGKLSYPDCLAALDAAFVGVVPYLTEAQMVSFRAITAAANEAVTQEIQRRKQRSAQAADTGMTAAP